MSVKVRFAPSPTGYLHIGGLRTALFNYLFAKKSLGTIILRIEDTDQDRIIENAVDKLLETFSKLNIKFDEGPGFGGKVGPYVQSQRLSIYNNLSQELNKKSLDGLIFNITNRFGVFPLPMKNLIKEAGIRASLAKAGISSVSRRGCGVVCQFEDLGKSFFAEAFLEYIENYWEKIGIRFHLMPTKGAVLDVCIHLSEDEDSFSQFSRFIGKFSVWKKTN